MFKALTFIWLFFVLQTNAWSVVNNTQLPGVLYFLNNPETIKHPGLILNTAISPRTVRVFFHFINATQKTQTFQLYFTTSLVNSKVSYSADFNPGTAGSNSAKKFLSLSPDSNLGRIGIRCSVKNQETISGIVEGTTIDDGNLVCKFGNGGLIPNVKIVILPLEDKNITVTAAKQTISMGISNTNTGEYGFVYRVTIKPTDPTDLVSVAISPRGGVINFVYSINGVVLSVNNIQAITYYHIIQNKTGETEIDTMPVGGYNYPVNILISCKSCIIPIWKTQQQMTLILFGEKSNLLPN